MEIPRIPQLPVLDKRPADRGVSDSGTADAAEPRKTPFKLSQLDLGSIGVSVSNSKTKRPGSRKRAATSAALDDDEDPLEEAQLVQLLQQMQKLKQSKENKRRKAAIAAKAKEVGTGVRRHAAKQVQDVKSNQDRRAAEIRSAMESLRKALEEEAKLASVRREEDTRAMREAVDTLQERYVEAAKVHAEVQGLRDCMRSHFPVVRAHVEAEVGKKIAETEETVQAIQDAPNRKLSFIKSVGSLA